MNSYNNTFTRARIASACVRSPTLILNQITVNCKILLVTVLCGCAWLFCDVLVLASNLFVILSFRIKLYAASQCSSPSVFIRQVFSSITVYCRGSLVIGCFQSSYVHKVSLRVLIWTTEMEQNINNNHIGPAKLCYPKSEFESSVLIQFETFGPIRLVVCVLSKSPAYSGSKFWYQSISHIRLRIGSQY